MTPTTADYHQTAALLNALAHPVRLQILEVLRDREVCVCDLQARLHQQQAYISQQLMALRAAGLVTCRKEGLRVYYRLNDTHLLELLDEVKASAQPGEEG